MYKKDQLIKVNRFYQNNIKYFFEKLIIKKCTPNKPIIIGLKNETIISNCSLKTKH